MTDLLLRLFVKHASDTSDPAVRAGYGRLAGVTGIVCNLLLFALKLLAGTISGSVSITADAVNNLSDASGSIVTLVGFKLASRPADNEHPYGHARMEYLSGLAVAVLILVIGVELVKSSVGKILHPEAVALGGGVAAAPEHLLLEPVREIVARECYARHVDQVPRIIRAELGNDAGIIGAAMLGRAI